MNKIMLLLLILVIGLTGCNTINQGKGCPDAAIEWADIMMFNDIKYTGDVEGAIMEENIKGEKLGEVKYMMADQACSNHQLRNGDAAFLQEGTMIYEYKGYNPDFRVIAGNKVYQVKDNHKAETISELYDIDGKVMKISLESSADGSWLLDFEQNEAAQFMKEFLSLEYVGFDSIYDKIKHSNSSFLRIHLNDGTSFRISYWFEKNIVNPGAFGTEKMKEIMEKIIKRKNIQVLKDDYDITGKVTERDVKRKTVLLNLLKKVKENEEQLRVIVSENTIILNKDKKMVGFDHIKQGDKLKVNLTGECEEPRIRQCAAEEIAIE